MSLFSKLKKLFVGGRMPDEARDAFDKSDNTRELLSNLDNLITRNEVEIKGLEKELLSLGKIEEIEANKIREGSLNEAAKRISLMNIKRTRKQRQNVEDRFVIFDKNITLLLNLVGKIQQMEAMQLRGVSSEEIDEIILDFETNFEQYTEAVSAAEDLEEHASRVSEDEDKLKELEEEIKSGERRTEADRELDEIEKEILESTREKKKGKEKEAEPEAE